MEITWFGHSCFRLAEKNYATVVTDPFNHQEVGYHPLKLSADIVTISNNTAGHNFISGVKGEPHTINGPGEYEIGNVFITGVKTNGRSQQKDEPVNTLYVFDFNGINVAHLGNINRVLSQTEVEALGPVHITLVPVGGGSCINAAKAAEVISMLEPKIVIPMHYATPDSKINLDSINKFLKVMGLTEIETLSSLKITNSTSLPEETQVVILDHQKS